MSDCNTCFYNLAGKSSDNRPGTLCSNPDVPKTRGIPDCPHYKKRYFYRLRDLEAENAKLRELCSDMFTDFANCDCELMRHGKTFMAVTRYFDRLCELGIEVQP